MDRFGNAGRGVFPVGFLYSDALGHPWVARESMGCMYGMYPAALDVNFTRDAGATNLGRYYFSFADAGEYEREVVSSTISGAQPILRFSGARAIPEPATSALAALALSLLLVRVGKRADR